ncbi:MAG: hypothetical protein WCA78_02405 [Rhizomicrobium sp.]
MSTLKNVLGCVASGLFLMSLSAQAAPLTIVNVNAPAINCVFNPSCKVVVNDSVGTFLPPGDSGTARLQSRTYPGVPGAPAAGLTAYVYRVDLTSATAFKAGNCVTKLLLNIGPIASLPYSPTGAPGQVFVVTSGGLGTIGLSSAVQIGNDVTFTFSKPVCPGGAAAVAVIPGQTSFFFGLAAKTLPMPSTAHLAFSLGGVGATAARVPTH